MALQLIKGDEDINIDNLNILIYGQPGTGKTSIGCTASNPLVLDFDKGAHRSAFRANATVARIDSWMDISQLKEKDLKPFDTIVIDTVGRALDYMTADIINENAKMGTRAGSLTMQGWGALKSTYSTWMKMLLTYGKDVILIAHLKEDKSGDDYKMRPDIPGGSLSEVLKLADFVGYMEKRTARDGNITTLNFNPTESTIGKNSAGLELLSIPNFNENNSYMQNMIKAMKDKIGKTVKAQSEAAGKVADYSEKINAIKNAEQCNAMIDDLKEMKNGMKKQVWHMLKNHAEKLKINFDEDAKVFVDPKPKKKAAPEKEVEEEEVPDFM
ncbi:MAG: ATP-binding protein [Candidatus Kapaibacterium sp.]